MSFLPTLTTVTAEIALALHPILIKQIPVSLPTQLLARLGTYSALGTALSSPEDKAAAWGSLAAAGSSILYGLMNLVHIGASYMSYQYLPAGSAIALFYTYPFMNILAGVLFLGDTFDARILPLLLLAFVGVLLITKYTKEGNGDDNKGEKISSKTGLGVAAALLAALTETLIFLVIKTTKTPSPFLNMMQLYPAAAVALAGWILAKKVPIATDPKNWIALLVFNIFIGFLGYSLRFFSIPLLPTAIFSLLTFIGVAAGYAWGLLFAGEHPSPLAATGAACITGSLGIMRFLGI